MLNFQQRCKVHSVGKVQSHQQMMLRQLQNDFRPGSPCPSKQFIKCEAGVQTFSDMQTFYFLWMLSQETTGGCVLIKTVGKNKKKDNTTPRKWGFTTGDQ